MRSAKIQDPALIYKTGLSIELLALEPIALVVVGKAAIAWIKSGKAAVRAQPQISFPVGNDALDHVIRQAIRGREACRCFRLRIQPDQTSFGSQPQDSV